MYYCSFCGRAAIDVEDAIEHGWIPSYWEAGGEHEISEPVCGECVEKHIEADADGEMVRVTD